MHTEKKFKIISKEKVQNLNLSLKNKENLKLYTYKGPQTVKKQYNYKLNHIKIKNIIRKIDLYSLSISKNHNSKSMIKTSSQKKKNKKKMYDIMKIGFNRHKTSKKNNKQKNNNIIRQSKIYSQNNLDNKNYISLTTSEIKFKHNKDFLNKTSNKNNNKTNNNININSKDILNINKNNSDSFNFDNNINNINVLNNYNKMINTIKNDYLNIKYSEINKNKNLKNKKFYYYKGTLKKFKKNNDHHYFKRNNTEFGRKDIDSNKHNLNNISSEKNLKKKNISAKNKNYVKKRNYSIEEMKEIKNNILISKKIKKYILKGNSAPKTFNNISKNKSNLKKNEEIKSKQILQKEFLKNNIPKPINTHIDFNSNKKKDFIHINNRQYNTEILDKSKNILTKTSNSKENSYKSMINNIEQENYIDYALINIRGLSIPGKDTNNRVKLNQDSYIIKRNINNINNFNIFGVFDGHGFYGNTISNYIKDNLIKKISEHPKIKALDSLEDIYIQLKNKNFKIIKDIFIEIDNQILNVQNEIDISLSGSTCNMIIEIGDHLIIANTGDSRAILIYENKNKKISNNKDRFDFYDIYPLSIDCKPNILQEKERILKNEGSIGRLKNSMQKEYGPLRVFKKGSDLPGLAMSRSFGDKLAKEVGVIVDPLIKEYDLNKNVKYIVIASDGIWEFMNNEQVMNIGNKYYINNDPDSFCRALIKKSINLWESNSRNIDDITLIVIFFTFL